MMKTNQMQRYLFEVSGQPRLFVSGIGMSRQGCESEPSFLLGYDELNLPVATYPGVTYRAKFTRYVEKPGVTEMDMTCDRNFTETIPLMQPSAVLEFYKKGGGMSMPTGSPALREIYVDTIVPLVKGDVIVVHKTKDKEFNVTASNEVARIEVLPRVTVNNLPEVVDMPERIFNMRNHHLSFNHYLDCIAVLGRKAFQPANIG